jgi:hypothetical protein
VSHIAESAGNEIEVIIVPPALPPIVPPAAARTKKKRKKIAAPAAPAAASDDASTAMPTPSIAPAMKNGKKIGKKKASKPVNFCAMLMWAKKTNDASDCIVAVTHEQKWVVGNAATINGDVANEPSSGCQWYQKGQSGERIASGNPEFAGMPWGRMRLMKTWAEEQG